MTKTTSTKALDRLAAHIRTNGPVPTVRVSSAQARGRAKKYAYWGVARYELRLTRDGVPANRVVSGARSDRRSLSLAWKDAEATGLIGCQCIGKLDESLASILCSELGLLYDAPEGQDELLSLAS